MREAVQRSRMFGDRDSEVVRTLSGVSSIPLRGAAHRAVIQLSKKLRGLE